MGLACQDYARRERRLGAGLLQGARRRDRTRCYGGFQLLLHREHLVEHALDEFQQRVGVLLRDYFRVRSFVADQTDLMSGLAPLERQDRVGQPSLPTCVRHLPLEV